MRPKSTPRVLALLVVVIFALTLTTAPAFAAAPETPETTTETPAATAAELIGLLNPNAWGTPGSYQFSYAQSATVCTPGTLDPASPELAMGLGSRRPGVRAVQAAPQALPVCLPGCQMCVRPRRFSRPGALTKTRPAPGRVSGWDGAPAPE